MKRILIIVIAFVLVTFVAGAQEKQSGATQQKFTQFSLRGGLDFGHKYNMPAVVKMPVSGYNAGLSIDKYWSFWGIGIDIDAYRNKAAGYDSSDMSGVAAPWVVKQYTDSATKLNRLFAGIGPSFKFHALKNKLVTELNLRGGISYVDGSAIKADALLTDISGPINMSMFNHAGYDKQYFAAAKAQARVNYSITPKLAFTLGAYYLYHINSEEPYSYSEIIALPINVNYVTDISSLSSYGAFAGLSYRIFPKGSGKTAKKPAPVPEAPPVVVEEIQQPVAIVKDVIVYVKDEQTGQPLYNAMVIINDESGKGAKAYTDKSGMVRFPKTASNVYAVNGSLNDIASTTGNISKTTFEAASGDVVITLTHNDPRFTLVGKSINKSNGEPESDVSVTLTNETKSSVRMSASKAETGEFRFQLDPGSDFNVVGKKQQYISNIERVSTRGLNRSQALYVQLELGVEEATAGKSIKLENIYYDLNKADIRAESGSDLRKLTVFLQDNPDLRIEISSHTDSRGSDVHNLKLSQARAQSVVNYLVNNGIARDRMVAKGYGETQLVNKCANGVSCSESEHQKNRRTEIKVLGK